VSASREDIKRQIHPHNGRDRKEWLKYESVYVDPFFYEPSEDAFLAFKRTGRLYDELTDAYLEGQYLTSIILCGVFAELCEISLRDLIIGIIEEKLSLGYSEDEVAALLESRTGEKRDSAACSVRDFVNRFKPGKGDEHLGFSNASEREDYWKELVKWKIITVDAKGALTEIKNCRDRHVHCRFDRIIERYKKDYDKFRTLFEGWMEERKKEMIASLHQLEWHHDLWLFDGALEKYHERMKMYRGLLEDFWILPCQTQIDYVEIVAALKRFVEGERIGFLACEKYDPAKWQAGVDMMA